MKAMGCLFYHLQKMKQTKACSKNFYIDIKQTGNLIQLILRLMCTVDQKAQKEWRAHMNLPIHIKIVVPLIAMIIIKEVEVEKFQIFMGSKITDFLFI